MLHFVFNVQIHNPSFTAGVHKTSKKNGKVLSLGDGITDAELLALKDDLVYLFVLHLTSALSIYFVVYFCVYLSVYLSVYFFDYLFMYYSFIN